MAPLSLTVFEIIILQLGAVVLGMAIYFFISSKKSLIESSPENIEKLKKQINDWKHRYLNEIDLNEKTIINLKSELFAAEELRKKSLEEIEDLNWRITDLENRIEDAKEAQEVAQAPVTDNPEYLKQLSQAGQELRTQSDKINSLLEQVDLIKASEEKLEALKKENEDLKTQVAHLELFISKKDIELKKKNDKEEIYTEMSSMIDNANDEFRVLREKIQKLEAQLIDAQINKLDYENIKESYQRLTKEHREITEQNKRSIDKLNKMEIDLNETIDKLKESNFQRQQLQKKVNYMDELKNDLRVMSESNKSLESQLSRISELESMLNILSQEKNDRSKDKE